MGELRKARIEESLTSLFMQILMLCIYLSKVFEVEYLSHTFLEAALSS